MRLHLLEHDDLDFSNTNITMWAKKKGYNVEHTYVCNHEKLPGFRDFDWLMVMGGSPHAWEEDINTWLPDEKAFIAEAVKRNKMILGICFGAQLVAEALGGRVFPNKHKEIGWYEVNLTLEGEKSFLFASVPKKFVTFHWHADHFSLPPGCMRLAYSEPTLNQAFICLNRPIACVQFHPEFTRDMIRHFSLESSEDWIPDHYVGGRDVVLQQTEKMNDNYWLMEALLNNMDREFGNTL